MLRIRERVIEFVSFLSKNRSLRTRLVRSGQLIIGSMHTNPGGRKLNSSVTSHERDIRRRSENKGVSTATDLPKAQRASSGETPTDLGSEATRAISTALNTLLADMFALYIKTKTFHWHMAGPHFRDFHLLLDDHADKIYATTDVIAERVRKVGAPTLRSIGDISRRQRLQDNDVENLTPLQMLAELREDNLQLAAYLRETHNTCEEQGDVASASFLESWIDEAEQRVWYLFETCRQAGTSAAE